MGWPQAHDVFFKRISQEEHLWHPPLCQGVSATANKLVMECAKSAREGQIQRRAIYHWVCQGRFTYII